MTDAIRLRNYLLGLLEDGERDSLEDEVFGEERLFALLEAVEAEVMDDYAAGELSEGERRRWEAYMSAHPASVERLGVARALHRRFGGARGSRRWWLAGLAAAAMICIAVFLAWRPPGAAVVAVTLVPGGVRSAAEAPQFADVPAGAGVVRITWQNDGAAVQAFVRQIDTGNELWRGAVRGGVSEVPAALLAPGDYVATTLAEDGEERNDYTFRVRRR